MREDVPGIGPAQGKVWGSTQPIFRMNGIESHAIWVCEGGYCSKHLHIHKWNRFFVISGRLRISIFQDDYTEPDVTILDPGFISDVPPGVIHQFEAVMDTVAVEFYWTSLDPNDIDRCGTHGGKR